MATIYQCCQISPVPNIGHLHGCPVGGLGCSQLLPYREVLWPHRLSHIHPPVPHVPWSEQNDSVRISKLLFSAKNEKFRRQNLHSWMVFAWACRLGTFLFMRVLKDGSDRRFDKARDSPGTFLVFWSLQGVWVWVTLLPTLLLNTVKRDVPLGNKDYLGYGLWATGFLFEVVADMQKSIFRANPDNDVSLDLFIPFSELTESGRTDNSVIPYLHTFLPHKEILLKLFQRTRIINSVFVQIFRFKILVLNI